MDERKRFSNNEILEIIVTIFVLAIFIFFICKVLFF